MKPQNIKEFKALIKRYESITAEEIEDSRDSWGFIRLSLLTGIGNPATCTLCKAVRNTVFDEVDCEQYVYFRDEEESDGLYCTTGDNAYTYDCIMESDDITEDLLLAYKARAKHMRGILKQLNSKK